MSDDGDWVRITRDFDASPAEVWRMWTEPELFQTWYGPHGFSIPTAEFDLTVGGTRKINMEMVTPERSMSMWFIGVFKEISAPTRLVYTESMCHADGTLISPADMGMEGLPDVTEVIVMLEAAGSGTRMTMVHMGVKAGTAGEGGWKQAFEKLAEALAA